MGRRRTYPKPKAGIWAAARDSPKETYKLPDGGWLTVYRCNDQPLQAPEILV